MQIRVWYRLIKSVLTRVTYVCVVLLTLENCQGCHRGGEVAGFSERSQNADRQDADPGGIPNIENTCYMNSVLQIIAKLYPDIFESQDSALAIAGQRIVDKIKNDQDYVTRDEARAFHEALVSQKIDGYKDMFSLGEQESADEFMDAIWTHLSLPQNEMGQSYLTLIPPQDAAETSKGDRETSKDNAGIPQDAVKTPQDAAETSKGDGETSKDNAGIPKDVVKTPQGAAETSKGDGETSKDNAKTPQNDEKTSKGNEEVGIQITMLQLLGNRASETFINLRHFCGNIVPIKVDRNTSGKAKSNVRIQNTLELKITAEHIPALTKAIRFSLVGFILHDGPLVYKGHYVAYVNRGGQWRKYDDGCVLDVTPEQAEKIARKACLYFYCQTH